MRILNSPSPKFSTGKSVVIIKPYTSGNIKLKLGTVGTIIDVVQESFPDYGLFNIDILSIDFGIHTIVIGEGPAKEYMRLL